MSPRARYVILKHLGCTRNISVFQSKGTTEYKIPRDLSQTIPIHTYVATRISVWEHYSDCPSIKSIRTWLVANHCCSDTIKISSMDFFFFLAFSVIFHVLLENSSSLWSSAQYSMLLSANIANNSHLSWSSHHINKNAEVVQISTPSRNV